jgi:AcrR family transcriptional regulator
MVEMRLNAEERRQAILESALKVFAERGLKGTTTKDIAREAGVSEALLYRHFPSKDDLHTAIHDQLCAHKDNVLGYIGKETSSTALLVQIHFILLQLIAGELAAPDTDCVSRLLFQNMLDDGKFAREFHEQRFYKLVPKYKECLQAAIQSGEIKDTGLNELQCLWYLHHVAVMIRLNGLAETPTFEYRKNLRALLEDTLRFSLRGVGMTEEAIANHARTDTLNHTFEAVLQQPPAALQAR